MSPSIPPVRVRESDIAWMRQVISLLKDGGKWGWPDAGGVYRVNKGQQVLVEEQRATDEVGREVLRGCLHALGWSLQPAELCPDAFVSDLHNVEHCSACAKLREG